MRSAAGARLLSIASMNMPPTGDTTEGEATACSASLVET